MPAATYRYFKGNTHGGINAKTFVKKSVKILQLNYNAAQLKIERSSMENKTARLTVLVDPVKKKAFEELCSGQDLTPSQVIRQLMREYMEKHGVEYGTKSKIGALKKLSGK
jgi:predicted nuclease with TOPRIM domain